MCLSARKCFMDNLKLQSFDGGVSKYLKEFFIIIFKPKLD